MSTYNGTLRDWKDRCAGRDGLFSAFTPAGYLSLEVKGGDHGKLRLAPMSLVPVNPHERMRMMEDARMVGIRLDNPPSKGPDGSETWAVKIVRGQS